MKKNLRDAFLNPPLGGTQRGGVPVPSQRVAAPRSACSSAHIHGGGKSMREQAVDKLVREQTAAERAKAGPDTYVDEWEIRRSVDKAMEQQPGRPAPAYAALLAGEEGARNGRMGSADVTGGRSYGDFGPRTGIRDVQNFRQAGMSPNDPTVGDPSDDSVYDRERINSGDGRVRNKPDHGYNPYPEPKR